MTGRRRPDPMLIEKVLPDDMYIALRDELYTVNKKTSAMWSSGFGRYHIGAESNASLNAAFQHSVSLAREVCDSPTLLPSYALFAHYEGPEANLFKHRDDNACTYTIDMCVYQQTPWDLWIATSGSEGRPYTLHENQAMAYFGNDQLHWREKFPDPDNNFVAMIFFHYVEPEHWYYTHGPNYIETLRSRGQQEARTRM